MESNKYLLDWHMSRQAIPINIIEKNIASQPKRKYRNTYLADKLISNSNVSDVHVVSPFYARTKTCLKSHCRCPFHKKQTNYITPINHSRNKTGLKQDEFKSFHQANQRYGMDNAVESPKEMLIRHKQTFSQPISPLKQLPFNKFQSPLVDCFNQDYEEFLRTIKRYEITKNFKPSHLIKSSVKEIFQYLYTHLHQSKEDFQKYIDTIEKDREYSMFYVDRFEEIKQKLQKKIIRRKMKLLQSSHQKVTLQKFHKNSFNKLEAIHCKENQKQFQNSKYLNQENLAFNNEKINRKQKKQLKSQKLLMEEFLREIFKNKNYDEIKYISSFLAMNLRLYQDNFALLRQKIISNKMTQINLERIKHPLLTRFLKQFQVVHPKSHLLKQKTKIVQKLIKLINKKCNGNNIEQEDYEIFTETDSEKLDHQKENINYDKSKKYRKSMISNGSSESQEGSSHENLEHKSNSQQQFSKEQIHDKQKQISIHVSLPDSEKRLEDEAIKIKKLRAINAKQYRRFSHDIFLRRASLETDDSIMQKLMKNMEVGNQNLQVQFQSYAAKFEQEKRPKMKKIEVKLTKMHMSHMIVNQVDSLLTAKRKARALKQVLRDQTVPSDLRNSMTDYLALVNQYNCIKNYKWAVSKFKNNRFQEQDVALEALEDEIQLDEDLDRQLIKSTIDLFNELNHPLKFYIVKDIFYQQKAIQTQSWKHFSKFVDDLHQKEIPPPTQKVIDFQPEKKKETFKNTDCLIQTGLESAEFSHKHLFNLYHP